MPPHICHIWERPSVEGRSSVSPAYLLGSCAKGKTAIYGGGMGMLFANPKGIGQNWDSK